MRQLIFRLCEAIDGKKFALLSDDPYAENLFDMGYKVTYKHSDYTGQEMLGRWRSSYSISSNNFHAVSENEQLPELVQNNFDNMVSNLIKGVDIFFCNYSLAIEADLPICNNIMKKYKSTDFVIFSCNKLTDYEPDIQPYIVSYAVYSGNNRQQHRIYCKNESFAFSQAVQAIVNKRDNDNLTGGHIRPDIDPYISEPTINPPTAEQIINNFVESLK